MTREDASLMLREARDRSGLTQAEVGRRAGVPQSAVSAYESGKRQPTLPVLQHLLAAAGSDLRLELVDRPPASAPFTGPVGRRVQRRRQELRDVLERSGFGNPEVFGSVARNEDRPDSDLDLLVDLPPGIGLIGLLRAQDKAAHVVEVPVELIPRGGLKPWVAREVERDLVAL